MRIKQPLGKLKHENLQFSRRKSILKMSRHHNFFSSAITNSKLEKWIWNHFYISYKAFKKIVLRGIWSI